MITTHEYFGGEVETLEALDLPDCPFCGLIPRHLIGGQQNDGLWSYVVHCEDCGADGPGMAAKTRSQAIDTACQQYRRRETQGARDA